MALQMLATSIRPAAHRNNSFTHSLHDNVSPRSSSVCSRFKHIAAMPRSTPRTHLIPKFRRKKERYFLEEADGQSREYGEIG